MNSKTASKPTRSAFPVVSSSVCASRDPIATLKIEELITQLSRDYTVVIVTHNMQQAVRVSDFTAFLHLGKLVEFAPTEELFTNPREKLTDSYLRGTFS